jgi:transposase InsO family protein
MRLHANARTCPNSRLVMVRRFLAGRSREILAAEFAVSTRTVSKWVARHRAEGEPGLVDRSSAPRRVHRTDPDRVEAIAALRRLGMTGAEIAMCLTMPVSTVSAVLQRVGLGKLSRLEPPEPPNRYQRERPGELLHIDTKRLGRFWEPGKRVLGDQAGRPHRNRRVGWQHLHVAIDDHSRLAYAELLPGQDAEACVHFLERAVAWYQEQGVAIELLLTDNAKAYHSRAWLQASERLGLERRYTRIYRPRTNGKAERFIQTLLREWAYARSYRSSSARARALGGYLRWYNRRRPHSSLGARPPISRVSHLCGHDT